MVQEEDNFNIQKILSYSAISIGLLVGIGLIYKNYSTKEEKNSKTKKETKPVSTVMDIFQDEIILPEEDDEDIPICIIPLGDNQYLNFTKSKMNEIKPKMISQIESLSDLKPKVSIINLN
jgi:hypothetical protein